jgi:hypothetical protein
MLSYSMRSSSTTELNVTEVEKNDTRVTFRAEIRGRETWPPEDRLVRNKRNQRPHHSNDGAGQSDAGTGTMIEKYNTVVERRGRFTGRG